MSINNPADIRDRGGGGDALGKEKNLERRERKLERKSEWFTGQELSPGLIIDVLTYPQQPDHYMAYMPETDNIYIFGKSYDELEAGHEANIDLAGLHESDHALYFRLPTYKQMELNDIIMGIVTHDAEAANLFKQFVQAMYRRPGGDYLKAHLYSNPEVIKILKRHDEGGGLRDDRYLDIDVDGNGHVERLYLGLVMTEFFAYMSATHHPQLLDEDLLNSINVSEVVGTAKIFREKFIDPNPVVQEKLANHGGHGLRRSIPDFKKYIT